MDQPPYARSYPHHVANVVLALFPGLINTSAIALLGPVIGADLRVPAGTIGELPLLNDAALAFGCLLGAEIARRVAGRTLFFWLMSLSLLASLASALAPTYDVLFAAHVAHGLLGGMLFVVMLPPLLTTFGSAKITTNAMVLVPSLFGAATLGPLLAGLLVEPQWWRAMFAIEVGLSAINLALGAMTLERREPAADPGPPDFVALALAAAGSTGIFLGVGALAQHDWNSPSAFGPLVGGVGAFVAMYVVEALKRRPLVPVRRLVTSIALIGALASVLGSACFAATQQCMLLSLERIEGLGIRATGFALWPTFLAAFASGVAFARLIPTRWFVRVGSLGLLISAAAALAAKLALPIDAVRAGWIAPLAGLGAGLAVTPGIFVVTLSFERELVARAVALLNLLRLTGGFVSGPGVEHTIGNRTYTRVADLVPNLPREAVRRFIVTGLHDGLPLGPLQGALNEALGYALTITFWIAALGALVITLVIAVAHVPVRAPNLAAIDDGKPAIGAAG